MLKRVEIIERRLSFEQDPEGFWRNGARPKKSCRKRSKEAEILPSVKHTQTDLLYRRTVIWT
jgi:Mg-chelatase subunit ChlI